MSNSAAKMGKSQLKTDMALVKDLVIRISQDNQKLNQGFNDVMVDQMRIGMALEALVRIAIEKGITTPEEYQAAVTKISEQARNQAQAQTQDNTPPPPPAEGDNIDAASDLIGPDGFPIALEAEKESKVTLDAETPTPGE